MTPTNPTGPAPRTLTARLAPLLPTRLVAATARAVYPRFEPELARLTDLLPPDCGTAVDVGGWYGPWTHRLWRHAREVVTVEPVPHLARLLAAAAPAHARVIPAAASDRPGTARLWLPPDDEGDRGVSSLVRRDIHARAVHVQCVTLDGLGLREVGFIKIDVDGSELAVLHGATGLLTRDRPALFVELESRIQPIAPVVRYLSLLGYEGWVLPDRNRDWVRLADFPLEKHQARNSYVVSQGLLRRVLPFARGPRYVNSVLFLTDGRTPGVRPDVSAVRDDGSHARSEPSSPPLQPPRLPTRPAAPYGGPQPGPGRERPS
ncbi:FkbM family methyltransferase [Streptomyces sp. NRRL F-525]|uniref:FkbM family methyltransferase n=1 Tax=Streptomyces sp. NRRL F-525 TaxID=1463861 RepID=UPI000526A8F8|nr:FkbM family methyltransferase [Streptomyces sp. NRRL F-525]